MVLYYGEHSPYAHQTMFTSRHGTHPTAHHHQAYSTLNALAAYTGNQNAGGHYDFTQYPTNNSGDHLQVQHQSAMASAYFYDYRGNTAVNSPVSLDEHWNAFGNSPACNIPIVPHLGTNSCPNNQLVSPGFRTSPASHGSSTGADNYNHNHLGLNSTSLNPFGGLHTPHPAFSNLNTSGPSSNSSLGSGTSNQEPLSSPSKLMDNTTKMSNENSPIKAESLEWTRKTSAYAPVHHAPVSGKTRTKDKYRVVYSDHQRMELEKEFFRSKYISVKRKAEMARSLQLSERQVKIWFQNRRAKERKQNKKKVEPVGMGASKLGCGNGMVSSSLHNSLLVHSSLMQSPISMHDDRHYDHIHSIKMES